MIQANTMQTLIRQVLLPHFSGWKAAGLLPLKTIQLLLLLEGQSTSTHPGTYRALVAFEAERGGGLQPINISQHLYRNRLGYFKELHLCTGMFTAGCPLPGFLEP